MTTKATDTEFEEHVLDSVEPQSNGAWAIGHESWTLMIPAVPGLVPRVGDVARFYGRGIGAIVRGVDINGVEVYYRTPEQQAEEDRQARLKHEVDQKERFEASRSTLDAQYDALPSVFQKRLDRFRRNNPAFRWRFEAYEMSCCVDAVNIAAACPTPEAIKEFYDMPWERQKEQVPDLSDGHSGKSFGVACLLARTYIERAAVVPLLHGALCGLTGCDEYGCTPLPTADDVEAAEAGVQ